MLNKAFVQGHTLLMKPRGTPMCEPIVIQEGDALRDAAETFIRNVYAYPSGVGRLAELSAV